MSFVQVLSKIFGNKSQRDLKAIMPIVDKIKAIEPTLESLSNDELRRRIDAVRADLNAATREDNTEISTLREQVETMPFEERQPIW